MYKRQLDGKPGIDLRGLTMANFYKEVSAGKVDFDAGPAGVLDWVKAVSYTHLDVYKRQQAQNCVRRGASSG